MVDANLSNNSQIGDGMIDAKGNDQNEGGGEKLGILNSILNDNDDSYK